MKAMTPDEFAYIMNNPKDMIETLKRAEKKMQENLPKNLEKLLEMGIITKAQKKKFSKKELGQFIESMLEVAEAKKNKEFPAKEKIIFLTADPFIIKRRVELEKTFSCKIRTMEESIPFMKAEMEKIDKKDRSYIG